MKNKLNSARKKEQPDGQEGRLDTGLVGSGFSYYETACAFLNESWRQVTDNVDGADAEVNAGPPTPTSRMRESVAPVRRDDSVAVCGQVWSGQVRWAGRWRRRIINSVA